MLEREALPEEQNFKFMEGSVNYRLTLEDIKISDGTLTTIVEETLAELVNHFMIEDNSYDLSYHWNTQNLAPTLPRKDKAFGKEEIERTLSKMNSTGY